MTYEMRDDDGLYFFKKDEPLWVSQAFEVTGNTFGGDSHNRTITGVTIKFQNKGGKKATLTIPTQTLMGGVARLSEVLYEAGFNFDVGLRGELRRFLANAQPHMEAAP